MSARVRLRSLAKINLDLRVLGKRPDGFHNIRTIFQTVSLTDTIEIEYSRSRRLEVILHSKPAIPGNLVERAAKALGIPGRFEIWLRKRIPMGAGLGGGSSNAAAMLLAIPALTGKRVPLAELVQAGAELGSDVPFFLIGGTALGLGRGTELHALPDVDARPALIVAPGIHVSTASAYRALNRPADDGTMPLLDERAANDFEEPVFREYPKLKAIKRALLRSGAQIAMMSGSGSSVFGIFADKARRDAALSDFPGTEKALPVSFVRRKQYRELWWRQLGLDTRTWPPSR